MTEVGSWIHDLDCPQCNSSLVMCRECWQDLVGCQCEDSTVDLFCGDCLNEYTVELAEILEDEDDDMKGMTYEEWYEQNEAAVKGVKPKNNSNQWHSKCRHFFEPIELVDGYKVYPSSLANDRTPQEMTPDFGLYADFMWEPGWRNEYIVWPDFEIPDFYDTAVEQIHSATERIVNGERVEIGCIGGHGRTGTIAACILVTLSAMFEETLITPTEAITFIRREYCRHAVETEEQEWWVEYYSHSLYGSPEELREKPKSKFNYSFKPSSTKADGNNYMPYCTEREHYEMIEAGADSCLQQLECEHWDNDYADWWNKVPLVDEAGESQILDKTRINNWRIMLQVKLQKYGTKNLEVE